MINEYLESMNDDMKSAVAALEKELTTVRTGRASPQLLENVQVDVATYGAVMPLNQLASVAAPDARLLVVTPWDKSTLGDIEKAIGSSGLGLNPSSDGQIVRVPIPALTGERRQELTKVVRRHGEDGKIRIRNARREYNEVFKGMESDKDISKDELERLLKQVQTATDEHVAIVDSVVSAKETELLDG
ncbi:MAG: ribosome recycling factor [Myxococcota bacterium]|jgi:ribosome recycling factor|nr:ribosome recycling factor [Myxococcota bacterium]